jgi:signal peptidase I
MKMTATKKRYPIAAALLSLVMPGLGHLYIGMSLAPVLIFFAQVILLGLAEILLLGSFAGFIAVVVLFIAVRLGVAVDAAKRARSIGKIELRWFTRWYIYPLVVVLVNLNLVLNIDYMRALTRYHAYRIPSGAMMDTLLIGDHVMVDMWAYWRGAPERGDIIVFRYPEDPRRDFIHRCVAVGGDTVEIRNKHLHINGVPCEEPYTVFKDLRIYSDSARPREKARDNFGPFTVPDGAFFCLGDNRDNSLDSRFWGIVDRKLVRGRAIYTYWGEERSRIGVKLLR